MNTPFPEALSVILRAMRERTLVVVAARRNPEQNFCPSLSKTVSQKTSPLFSRNANDAVYDYYVYYVISSCSALLMLRVFYLWAS